MTENTHLYTSNLVAFTTEAFLIFIETKAVNLKIFYKSLVTAQTHILTDKKSKKIDQHSIKKIQKS